MKRNLLALILLGQCLDALTFVLFYRVAPPIAGPTEQNKIIVAAMAAGGLAGVALLKVGLGWLTTVTGWGQREMPSGANRKRSRRERLGRATLGYRLALRNVLLVGATASGFIGAAFNARAIWQVIA